MRNPCSRLLLAVMLAACAPDTLDMPRGREELAPTDLLVRASMALRGVRPDADDLRAVQRDPESLPDIVGGYLDDPGFADTVRELHAEALLLDMDPALVYFAFPATMELSFSSFFRLNTSLARAPTELAAHVVMNDLPYTELVTADYVMANAEVAAVLGLPYDPTLGEWQPTVHVDGRSAAGLLSDSAVYLRHDSTDFNAGRGRAQALSRALLCYDFLDREVEIDLSVDISDDQAIRNAIQLQPACRNCHQTLDPLASFFAAYGRTDSRPLFYPIHTRVYQPEFALARRITAPAYFGEPGRTLRDLGRSIARDPRFASCAARRFASHLMQVRLDDVPRELVARLARGFVESGYRGRTLALDVVLSPEFRTVSSGDPDDAWIRPSHLARPAQLARAVEALTGYRMQLDVDRDLVTDGSQRIGVIDLMTDSIVGYETLGGGTDGFTATSAADSPNATSALVREALARRAAAFVTERDFATPDRSARRLFSLLDPDEGDEAVIRAQLALLHTRALGLLVSPSSPEVDEWLSLWRSLVGASGDARRAWALTLVAMLTDLRFATY